MVPEEHRAAVGATLQREYAERRLSAGPEAIREIMFRGILNTVPTVVLVLAVVGVTCGAVLLAVWLIRRWVPATREEFNSEIVAAMLGVLAALFGLLLAFVVVIEFQNHDDARANVEEEADALAAIVRDTQALDGPDTDAVRAVVLRYVDAVIEDEWPRMQEGQGESPRAAAAIDELYATMQSLEPQSTSALTFYEDAVRQLNNALDARRDRLADAEGGLPGEVAALIIVGSLAILIYATLVGSRSFWFHAIGAGLIAVLISFSLVVLLGLSYPFSGGLEIPPDAFQEGILGVKAP